LFPLIVCDDIDRRIVSSQEIYFVDRKFQRFYKDDAEEVENHLLAFVRVAVYIFIFVLLSPASHKISL